MVYVFRCKKCDTVEEVALKPSEVSKHAPNCPNCNEPMQRVFTLPGIRFVGPGFHVNDYPKK
jgi:putative FmdB family regulatory protein